MHAFVSLTLSPPLYHLSIHFYSFTFGLPPPSIQSVQTWHPWVRGIPSGGLPLAQTGTQGPNRIQMTGPQDRGTQEENCCVRLLLYQYRGRQALALTSAEAAWHKRPSNRGEGRGPCFLDHALLLGESSRLLLQGEFLHSRCPSPRLMPLWQVIVSNSLMSSCFPYKGSLAPEETGRPTISLTFITTTPMCLVCNKTLPRIT